MTLQQMGFLGGLVMELILLIKPITMEWVGLLAEMMNTWTGEERTTSAKEMIMKDPEL